MSQTFCEELQDTHIRLKYVDITAVACTNRIGSIKPVLMSLTREIWLWEYRAKLHCLLDTIHPATNSPLTGAWNFNQSQAH